MTRSRKQNNLLHLLYKNAKKLQPDTLDVDVKGSTTSLDVSFDVNAEWRKKQRFRKFKRT